MNDISARLNREKPEQIADQLRMLIVNGELSEGDWLGREPDLVKRFKVSRPSLREALRILEAEGLITVMRGVLGGVIVHEPDHRMTARTVALVLHARDVSLADVYSARSLMEPAAARAIAESRSRRSACNELRALVDQELRAVKDPHAFGSANAAFHQRLVALAGNQTLAVVADMLNEIIAKAVIAVSEGPPSDAGSAAVRLRGIRSQSRLLELIEAGDGVGAQEHWRVHMTGVDRILIGYEGTAMIDSMHHR